MIICWILVNLYIYIYIQRPLCVFQVVSGKSDRLIAVFLGGSFERRPSPAFVVL